MTTGRMHRDADAPLMAQCLKIILAMGGLASVVAVFAAGTEPALAVALGSTLAAGNLWLLGWLVRRWLSPTGTPTAWGLLLPVKLIALIAVLYGLVAVAGTRPLPLLVGFALLPCALLVAQLRGSAAAEKG
jgi:hypothetical protein